METASLVYLVLNEFAALAFFGAAFLVLAAGARRLINITLAAFLVIYGANLVVQGLSHAGVPDVVQLYADLYRGTTAITLLALYPLFFARAIDSPFVRPLRHAAVQLTLAVVAGALVLAAFISPSLYGHAGRAGEGFVADGPIGRILISSPMAFNIVVLAVFALPTIASYDAYRRASPDSLAKRRGLAYLTAFIVNDISGILGFLPFGAGLSPEMRMFLVSGVAVGLSVVFLILLTRALLREQLFDFDLKLKINIERGTIAGAFLGVFFVVTQVAENYLSDAMGYVAGGTAAGLLLFAIAPLQRAAERIASAAVPGVVDSPEYRLVKKRDVYRAALEGALEDGGMTPKERKALARLADQLGLSVSETLEIEGETRAPAQGDGVIAA